MKYLASVVLAIVLSLSFLVSAAKADEYVNGYYRSNGTYVNGYYRSSPDGNPYNNYSFPGNYNPYTGVTATGNPDTYLSNYYDYSYPTYGSYYSYPSYSPYLYDDYSSPYDSLYDSYNSYDYSDSLYGY
jgi:hypothetical protein